MNQVNSQCLIEIMHSKRGLQVVEKTWSALCYEWIIPFGGKALVKKIFKALSQTGKADIQEKDKKDGTIYLSIKRGQQFILFNSGMFSGKR